jgi:hypothetical protein
LSNGTAFIDPVRAGRARDRASSSIRKRMVSGRCATSRSIDLKTSEGAALADTLDGISAAMLLVDARGRIIHTNASGRALLAEGYLLRASDEATVRTHLLRLYAKTDTRRQAELIKLVAGFFQPLVT